MAHIFIGFFPCLCFPLIGGLGLLLTIVWIWMLVDAIQNEPSEGNDKLVWILVIVLLQGIGGAIYYFVRRPERIRKYGK